MNKNLKLLKILSLIAGILLLVYYSLNTISKIILLFRTDFEVKNLLGFSTLIGVIAGILLIKSSKKLKSGENESGIKVMQIASILLLVLPVFTLVYLLMNLEFLKYAHNGDYIFAQVKHFSIPILFPILFFIFKKK